MKRTADLAARGAGAQQREGLPLAVAQLDHRSDVGCGAAQPARL
ncbi:MAG TPA: hypothetical protein VII01_13605 [Solirubrobacteraceae bacterium]